VNSSIEVRHEIRQAIAEGRPVVALESTIVAHGMSYPRNVETALEVEDIVRSGGAVPCTIAVLDGKVSVGLEPQQIEELGRNGSGYVKCSTRDLPFVIATGKNGATTVAATARIAALCGIRVFATGGIGGVHRDAERTFDVSADLHELARSDVAVVTAGAKSILDLRLTLEVLETLGVPVIGFGCDEFPAFYSRQSGLPLSQRVDTPEMVATLMRAKWSSGLAGGLVIANPIPKRFEIPETEIAPAIREAVGESRSLGIGGKDLTPYLLARVAQKTTGRSLGANIALIRNNAALAAQIAVAYCGG
jgi:pseudouridine-5'-phosphate glycosidase